MNFLLIAVALFSLAHGQEYERFTDKHFRVDITDVVERALPIVAKYMIENELDPMGLPDITKPIEFKAVFWHKGDIHLSQGLLKHLSTIRAGNVSLAYQNRILSLDAEFDINRLNAYYNYQLKLKILSQRGWLEAAISNVKTRIAVDIDLLTYKLTLTKLEASVEALDIVLKGNGLTDWITNLVVASLTTSMKNEISAMIERDGKPMAQNFLNDLAEKFLPHRELENEIMYGIAHDLYLALEHNRV